MNTVRVKSFTLIIICQLWQYCSHKKQSSLCSAERHSAAAIVCPLITSRYWGSTSFVAFYATHSAAATMRVHMIVSSMFFSHACVDISQNISSYSATLYATLLSYLAYIGLWFVDSPIFDAPGRDPQYYLCSSSDLVSSDTWDIPGLVIMDFMLHIASTLDTNNWTSSFFDFSMRNHTDELQTLLCWRVMLWLSIVIFTYVKYDLPI